MKRLLYILYQPYKWFIFGPFFVISTFLTCILAFVLIFTTNSKFANSICGTGWSKLNSYLTPMFVKRTGKENIDKKQSYVIVSNHQSQYDIFVIYGWLGINFKWIMKQELRKIPVFGIASEKLGHIFIDRSNMAAALASINSAKKKIINGTSVFFFSEGTRSKDGKLGKFKKGAFRMAIDLNLPILPLTINGTRKILPPGTLDLFPGYATLTIHKPINTSDYSDNDIKRLMETTRKTIQSDLNA